MKTWKLALLIGGITAVAVFAAAAIAFGGGERWADLGGYGGGMMVAGDGDGETGTTGRSCGEGSGLMQDPQAREDMLKLRDEHRAEMSAWWEEYGDDPRSDAAQKALDELRAEHRADVVELFEKYGVTPPEDFGEGGRGGYGPGGPGVAGGCDGDGRDERGCGGPGAGAGQGMMNGGQAWGGSL